MKLRQKLAVVLASAMVVTAVPVVTMAASTSYATKTVTAAKDSAFATQLVIDVKDATTTTGQVIYLDITGAKFDETKAITVPGFTTKVEEKTITLTSTAGIAAGKITVDINGKDLTGDEVVVKIDGSATKAVDDQTVIVAKKSDAKATVTFGDAKSFDGEGAIADITIEEPFAGVFADKEITLELQNSNYEFTSVGTVEGSKGLSGVTVSASINSNDKQIIKVKANATTTAPGKIVLKGVTVKCKDKKPAAEEVSVNVYGDKVTEKEAVVAKVVEYGGVFKLSDKAVDITAGQSKKVKVKLVENLADSFMKGKTVEFTLDNAELKAAPAGTTAIHKDGKTDKEIIGFEYTIPTDSVKALDKEFELEIVSKLDQAGKDVAVTVSGRAIGADQTLTVASVKKAFEVSAEALAFETGLKGQKGGVLTIAEVEKGQLASGKTFQIKLEDGEFADKPEFKVTSGDLVIDKVEVDSTTKSILNVTVKRASKTASTFTISNFQVKANRLLADGSYSVKLGNFNKTSNALGNGELEVKDFMLVGEKAPTGTSTFTLGATTYAVNGKEYTMDVAPYIEGGRIMVPVKYVAAALGVDGANVVWDSAAKTVTIFGDRTVQVTLGSNVALVNGAPITMDGKVVMQSNRTFVPVAEIGKLLGVKATWDATAKSATFSN